MPLCEYGCGQEAKYQFKNGKWCCSENWQSCLYNRDLVSKTNSGKGNPLYGKKHSEESKKKIASKQKGRLPWNKGKERRSKVKKSISEKLKGREPWNKGRTNVYSSETLLKMKKRKVTDKTKEKLKNVNILTIEKIKIRYPFFSYIEEMQYNPNKLQEIQVHCKNHNCKNSKEKSGWFTPTRIQLYERIRQLEKDYGNDGCYLYCCDECKQKCPLYNIVLDPYKKSENIYTQSEYKQFTEYVLERDDYKCQYCGKKAEHVHHERPQKLEPFFALDPDLSWSVCSKCHYKYGHQDECSTGNLAYKICK